MYNVYRIHFLKKLKIEREWDTERRIDREWERERPWKGSVKKEIEREIQTNLKCVG